MMEAVTQEVCEHDRLLWACGDALVAETDGSRHQHREACTALEEHGFDGAQVVALYRTAKRFPPATRRPIAWKWHALAHNEGELQLIGIWLEETHREATIRTYLTAARRLRATTKLQP
jgi:hypothetical protein